MPLQSIEEDILSLLKEVASLKSELGEQQAGRKKEQKVFLLGMLDVLDSFDRLFANIEPKEAAADKQARIWVNNFRSVRRVLLGQLETWSVARIEAPEGRALPGFHTIVDTRPNPDLDNDTILEEVLKGYLWRGEVLRKSEVVVVKN